MRWIATNAGQEGNIVVAKVREMEAETGLQRRRPRRYENLIEAGVIDPTKVVRFAIQNAASIAGADAHHRGHRGGDPGEEEGRARCLRRRHGRLLSARLRRFRTARYEAVAVTCHRPRA